MKREKIIKVLAIIIGIIFLTKEFVLDKPLKFSDKSYEQLIIMKGENLFYKKNGKFFHKGLLAEKVIDGDSAFKISGNYIKMRHEEKNILIDKDGKKIEIPKNEEIIRVSEDRYVLLKDTGKYFYYDIKDKKNLTDRYERLDEFKEGIAFFIQDRKTGYVKIDGKHLTEERYLGGTPFKNGYAIVKTEGNGYRYIDTKGKISEIAYDFISILDDGALYLKENEKTTLLRKNKTKDLKFEEYLGSWEYKIYFKDENSVVGYNTKNGKTAKYKIDNVLFYKDGSTAGVIDGGIKLYNEKGEAISDDFSTLTQTDYNKLIASRDNRYGIIDTKGKIIVPMKYDSLKTIPGYNIVEVRGKFGILDDEGREVYPVKYNDIIYTENRICLLDETGWRYSTRQIK